MLAYNISPIFVLVAVIIGIIMGFVIGKTVGWQQMRTARTDAVKRSKSSILGEVYEKIAPFADNFPFAPKDMVFIGKGFDYLVIDGLSTGNINEIVFLEIKSGSSTLNANERKIRDAVNAKRVRFMEWRADKM